MKKKKRSKRSGRVAPGGFNISQKELKEFHKMIDTINRRRKASLQKIDNAIKQNVNNKNVSIKGLDEEMTRKGYVREKQSKALNQFKSKEEFKQHMQDLKTMSGRWYDRNKLADYREETYQKILEKTDDPRLARKIVSLSNEELIAINRANPSFREAIWDSDQKLSTSDWQNKISSCLDEYMKQKKAFNSMEEE